jgi:hypothetical protein
VLHDEQLLHLWASGLHEVRPVSALPDSTVVRRSSPSGPVALTPSFEAALGGKITY